MTNKDTKKTEKKFTAEADKEGLHIKFWTEQNAVIITDLSSLSSIAISKKLVKYIYDTMEENNEVKK